jgi:hypothetical protein
MSIKNISRNKSRYSNKTARLVVNDDGNDVTTFTTRTSGNRFYATSSRRPNKTELNILTKNGIDVKLDGRDARTLYKILSAHFSALLEPGSCQKLTSDTQRGRHMSAIWICVLLSGVSLRVTGERTFCVKRGAKCCGAWYN